MPFIVWNGVFCPDSSKTLKNVYDGNKVEKVFQLDKNARVLKLVDKHP